MKPDQQALPPLTPVSTLLQALPFDKSPRLIAAVEMGHAAAGILREFHLRGNTREGAQIKTTAAGSEGLVTAADLGSEAVIAAMLRERFPGDAVLSEEGTGATLPQSASLWIIDPLDGTNNFACGLPHFSLSIAWADGGRTQLGVVVDPVRDDWFIAAAGEGAWHNGRRARVSSASSLAEVMIGFGFYYDRGALMRATLKSVEALFGAGVLGVRRFGSAALDLCYVGVGRFGGFFEYTLSPWDFAAGALFVEEAGGQVSSCLGNGLQLQPMDLLASNARLHPLLLECVADNLRTAR